MDIVKNPIVIALVSGVITYVYLSWQADKNNKKKKHRKNKEEVNLMIPFVVSLITWFLAYAYFEYTPVPHNIIPHALHQNVDISDFDINKKQLPLPIPPSPGYKFVGDIVPENQDPRFSLLTTGVQIPKNLPDSWLDIY